MFTSIGPLKSIDLLNAIDYRIENLRDKLAKAAASSTDFIQVPGISQEIVEAYTVRAAIKRDCIYEAKPASNHLASTAFDGLLIPAIADVAERLVNRYVCNFGTENEFIACVTPSKETIGTGAVWDDWILLKTLVDQVTGRRAGGKS